MRELLDHGHYPAIATHDPAMIEATQALRGERKGYAKDRFEFQMLYGIRRDLQTVAGGRRLSACASTCRSASSGSRISCAASASGRRTWRSCCAASSSTGSTRVNRSRQRHQRRASATSASRQASTLAASTHSSTPCSPAPVGPNSSDGMPASPSTDASVQKLIPIGVGCRLRRRVLHRLHQRMRRRDLVRRAREHRPAGGPERRRRPPTGVTRRPATSRAALPGASPGIVRRSICRWQRSG